MERPEHCTAASGQECWECRQSWLFRVTERRINRAILLVKGRAKQAVNETENISKLEHAVRQLRDLHNAQWREMVRKPFKFKTEEPTEKKLLTKLDLADLGL